MTNLVAPDRIGAFAALHARVPLELALFGGRSHHATGGVSDPGVPHRHVAQRDVFALARSGRYRAVVCGTAGRTALPASYLGARTARVPFVLWSALWAQPRSFAHLAGSVLLGHLHSSADAVVVYGPHVEAFARARGARRVFTAPQAVDGAFWEAEDPAGAVERQACRFAFVGRDAEGKGLAVLLEAWRTSNLRAPSAALVLVGLQPEVTAQDDDAVERHGPAPPSGVRNFLAGCDVLVVPSVPTPTFREPWGLVCNEAMHLGLPVIATEAVGAVAGGLVRQERNGLVVAPNDPGALAGAMVRLQQDPELRARLGAAGRRDVAPYTYDAWADGFVRALNV